MKRVSKIFRVLGRIVVSLLFLVALAVAATSFSAIYDFAPQAPFTGNDIFNPYADFDPNTEWKRTSLHTHTRVSGPLNECDYTAQETFDKYKDCVSEINEANEVASFAVGFKLGIRLAVEAMISTEDITDPKLN